MTQTPFGFQKVTPEEKREGVQKIFSDVSDLYDLMNDLMSGFQHRLWKNHLLLTFR
ncbi:MAG: hypothetical protein C0582_05105 [Alphaproteobacteria bacterium]|nr:MAG: hypothetical protein C0582_05105 [Alphaproteobacteria bacterium]